MFDRLGHVTYRRRRLVLALAGALPRRRRGLGDRGLRLDGLQRLRHPGQRVGPRAGPHRGHRRARCGRRRRPLPRRRPTGQRPGLPGRRRGRTWPTCPTDLVASTTTYWTAGPDAAAVRLRRRPLDVRRPAARRRGRRRPDGRRTRSSSRSCATPRRGWTSGSAATRRSPATSPPRSARTSPAPSQLSMPILLVLLVVIFGGLTAASLPLAIGGLAILGAFTMLRLLSLVTDVSVFSINIVTMLGLGLAIDYALFVVSPVPRGGPRRQGHRVGAGDHDGDGRAHRRVLRADRRDLARPRCCSSRRCSCARWASAAWRPCWWRWSPRSPCCRRCSPCSDRRSTRCASRSWAAGVRSTRPPSRTARGTGWPAA